MVRCDYVTQLDWLLTVAGDYAKLIAPFGIFPNTTVQTGNGCTNPGSAPVPHAHVM